MSRSHEPQLSSQDLLSVMYQPWQVSLVASQLTPGIVCMALQVLTMPVHCRPLCVASCGLTSTYVGRLDQCAWRRCSNHAVVAVIALHVKHVVWTGSLLSPVSVCPVLPLHCQWFNPQTSIIRTEAFNDCGHAVLLSSQYSNALVLSC